MSFVRKLRNDTISMIHTFKIIFDKKLKEFYKKNINHLQVGI